MYLRGHIQIEKQTDKETDRQTEIQTDRWRNRHT